MNNPTQLLPTDLIAVEVPKDANYTIHNNRLEFISQEKGFGCVFLSQTPKDKFRSLGEITADEINFDCGIYLEKSNLFANLYKFYPLDEVGQTVGGKNDAFYSLLQSNGIYWTNTIEKPDYSEYQFYEVEDQFEEALAKWQEAESKVIKGKGLILKKVTIY